MHLIRFHSTRWFHHFGWQNHLTPVIFCLRLFLRLELVSGGQGQSAQAALHHSRAASKFKEAMTVMVKVKVVKVMMILMMLVANSQSHWNWILSLGNFWNANHVRLLRAPISAQHSYPRQQKFALMQTAKNWRVMPRQRFAAIQSPSTFVAWTQHRCTKDP